MNESPSFTWLHLSDLRLGAPVQRSQWFSLQRPMASDLAQLQRNGELGIDCVCITGGLTESGSADAFYELRQFVDKALRPLIGPSLPIFVVPGPSDATRVERAGFGLRALRSWFSQPELAVMFFGDDPEDRKDITTAFAAFRDFHRGLDTPPPDWSVRASPLLIPGDYRAVSESRGVHIVGLNSAWLQPAFQDAAALGSSVQAGFDLNPEQLAPLLENDKLASLVGLLLTYHGPQALHPKSRETYFNLLNPPGPPRRFPLHLCAAPQGEPPRIELLRRGTQTDGLIVTGRSLCDTQRTTEPQVGYSLGRIRRGPEQVEFTIWPRRFHARRNVFVPDQDFDDLIGDHIQLVLGAGSAGSIHDAAQRGATGTGSDRPYTRSGEPRHDSRGFGTDNSPSRGNPGEVTRSAGPPAQGKPSRASVRRLMQGMLRTDSDLMAFLLDYYPEVYRRTSSGMDGISKQNLLLQLVDTSHIVDTLRRHDAKAFDRERRVIEFE